MLDTLKNLFAPSAARTPTAGQVVRDTAAMTGNAKANALALRHGLRILNVTWEDTGRFKGSAVGPNISDMTIQVEQDGARHCMPVIRYPNFTDRSADVPLEKFFVLVGNERGEALRPMSLKDVLSDLRSYLHKPDSWGGTERSLLAERDSHALVSAQACFLPVSQAGEATFNPVLFNYQSSKGAPAVLTILATREGTSVTIIDNVRDGFSSGGTWGQRLFFNDGGQRASLTASRKSDFLQTEAGMAMAGDAAAQEALNFVMLIQVPLVRPEPDFGMDFALGAAGGAPVPCAPAVRSSRRRRSTVEDAVIGHGAHEGAFTEIDGLAIERDARFPVRVTVQFYKATDNGVVSSADMAAIAADIKRVYAEADHVGSLVTGGKTARPTEHTGPQAQPPGWWADFWRLHLKNTGQTEQEAYAMLTALLGRHPADAETARRTLGV